MAAIQPPCPTKRSIRRVAGFTVGVTENGVPLVAANVMDHHFLHSETLVYGQHGTANFLTNHNWLIITIDQVSNRGPKP